MHEKDAQKQATETTIDGLLDNRIKLEQQANGYRVAVDTVLLAAAVPAEPIDRVLELGCGVGGAMLCLASRVPSVAVMGVEIQHSLALLCRDNIVRNKIVADLCVQVGDATKLSPAFAGVFRHVMMNPPYHDEARHDASPQAQKRVANTEKEGDLPLWIANAAKSLRRKGSLTLIHRADRLDEIIKFLSPAFGKIEIYRILPKVGAEPKRVVVRAYKDTDSDIQSRDFILHKADGGYTDEAEAILRKGEILPGTPTRTDYDILRD